MRSSLLPCLLLVPVLSACAMGGPDVGAVLQGHAADASADPGNLQAPDARAGLPLGATPGLCWSAQALVTDGLMADLASVVPAQFRDTYGEVFFDGLDVVAGYGIDIVDLRVPFATGPFWLSGTTTTAPAISELTLRIGGRLSDPTGNAAADQVWGALADRPETVIGWGIRERQTPGGRVSCSETQGTHACVFTQFQSVDVRSLPCPSALAPPFDAAAD